MTRAVIAPSNKLLTDLVFENRVRNTSEISTCGRRFALRLPFLIKMLDSNHCTAKHNQGS
jgi:hypothetical protein